MSDLTWGGYQATDIETNWYQKWEEASLFAPQKISTSPTYCITIPPPNITGSLHMGHALCYSIQDALGRYHRMLGENVLILPGQDHAGIATQSIVSKQLKAKGISPSEIGRAAFLEHVWEWRKESGDTILRQFKRLGHGFDWSRLRFTLDGAYVQAVLKVFIDWFDRGLIYRGLRVVNWDPVLKTSVSDIETERKEVEGHLYHVRYPFSDGSGEVVIATTRPETMLADVAVAVHPSDKRYEGMVGKTLRLPLMNREIPLVADLYPDPEFGTGAVKITPGHDANDFEVGQRHGLETLIIFDATARVNELGGAYAGLSREQARERVVADLEAQGFLVKVEPHRIPQVISDRSKSVIEPLASYQWFVKQNELAAPVIEAMRAGRIQFVPERYNDDFTIWLEEIKDWCISRQLWWGHRIPVYYTESGRAVAALNAEEAREKSGETIVRQEEDVLDTWFSSGLWPFATLGWPEDTDDLRTFYPTNVLVTDRSIINLWVARMAMMGIDCMDNIPFQEVYVHQTVLTRDGRRMSKSLGTGVDPMEIIEDKGADALRYALLSQAGHNQDLRYREERPKEAAFLCNKLWNAARFITMNLDGYDPHHKVSLTTVDEWILSRLRKATIAMTDALRTYDFQAGVTAVESFFWYEFADWYIEVSKARLNSPEQRGDVQWVLMECYETLLKLLHPVMPFITEELYARMPFGSKANFLTQTSWPDAHQMVDYPESEARVEEWIGLVRAVRALRAELNLAALKTVPRLHVNKALSDAESFVRSQAWFEEVVVGRPEEPHLTAALGDLDLMLPIGDLIDPAQELERLQREITKLTDEANKISLRLNNPQFMQNAKPEVVERDRSRVDEIHQMVARLMERKSLFGG